MGVLASGCTTQAPTGESGGTALPSDALPSVVSPSLAAPTVSTPSPTDSVPPLKIGSVSNFRDVAGDGLELAGGRRMATGVVYRSGKLSTASKADLRALEKAGVELVLDLRTDYVASRSPDPMISGARRELVNVFSVRKSPAETYRSVAAAQAHLRQVNIDFVSQRKQRAKLAKVLRLIASARGPVVVHCTEGKDRTGWVSAMLQYLAGADSAQVLTEYLKSNDYRAGLVRERYQETLREKGITAARIERARLRVDRTYLEAGLKEATKRYGGLDGYLRQGLGLSEQTIERLRDRLVAE